MKDDEINIAIAEACGWKLSLNGKNPMWSWQNKSIPHRIKWTANKDMAAQGVLPDYCNDLNAMHEAEKVLTPPQETFYTYNLGGLIVNDDRWEASELCADDQTYRATARQRAEAFLRTIGKWREAA